MDIHLLNELKWVFELIEKQINHLMTKDRNNASWLQLHSELLEIKREMELYTIKLRRLLRTTRFEINRVRGRAKRGTERTDENTL